MVSKWTSLVTAGRVACLLSLTLCVAHCGSKEGREDVVTGTSEAVTGGAPITVAASKGLCLDVAGGNNADGTPVQIWTCNGLAPQAWTYTGGTLQALGKCLDLPNANKTPGTKLQLWDCNGGPTQQWTLSGSNIVFAGSSLCVDIPGANLAAGNHLQVWTCGSSATAQRWNLPASASASSPSPSLPGWNLVWADEFNGTAIDTTKWAFEVQKPGWVNHELQSYTARPENARVENGHLVIEARNDNYQGNTYSSARLKTAGKQSWTYGRVEARIQIPDGIGTWPAFWMMPDDASRGWPACGEIDIMEEVGFNLNYIHASNHSQAFNWLIGTGKTAIQYVAGANTGFHTYAMEWSPSQITISADGNTYFTNNNPNTGDDAWPFDKNFYLILNLAVGGDWGASAGVDPNIWPRQMLVDYVRVYQR